MYILRERGPMIGLKEKSSLPSAFSLVTEAGPASQRKRGKNLHGGDYCLVSTVRWRQTNGDGE